MKHASKDITTDAPITIAEFSQVYCANPEIPVAVAMIVFRGPRKASPSARPTPAAISATTRV